MKVRLLFGGAVLSAAIMLSSCKDEELTPEQKDMGGYDYSEILSDYVDHTILPTYGDMKDNAKLLFQKTTAFKASSSQDDLNAACELWKATRSPWEKSEAFLFGPAAFNNLDPLLDSWPLDQAQLQQVLDSDAELSADYVRDGLGAVLRGFHTVEFLLFREGEPRNAAELTERERDYLAAVTEVLRDDCVKLWALWDGGATEQDILDAIDFEVGTPYAEEFKNAGNAGSRYISQTDAVDEILQGMVGIADEVANGKIADPHTSKNVLDVESWFSWNSLTDFQDNMRSIENSYLGGYEADERETSISDYVKEQDEALDLKVRNKITSAVNAIAAIPAPFRNNLEAPEVQDAMNEVNELMELIDGEVRPLIVN